MFKRMTPDEFGEEIKKREWIPLVTILQHRNDPSNCLIALLDTCDPTSLTEIFYKGLHEIMEIYKPDNVGFVSFGYVKVDNNDQHRWSNYHCRVYMSGCINCIDVALTKTFWKNPFIRAKFEKAINQCILLKANKDKDNG